MERGGVVTNYIEPLFKLEPEAWNLSSNLLFASCFWLVFRSLWALPAKLFAIIKPTMMFLLCCPFAVLCSASFWFTRHTCHPHSPQASPFHSSPPCVDVKVMWKVLICLVHLFHKAFRTWVEKFKLLFGINWNWSNFFIFPISISLYCCFRVCMRICWLSLWTRFV